MNEALERVAEILGQRYFGKYRGEVVGTADPTKRGRLLVTCPAVLGEQRVWALPAVPYAGAGLGLFALPPAGTSAWIEFEGGEINQPIWSGCFWKEGEIPAGDALEGVMFVRTPGATIRVDNDAGVVEIEASGGARITLAPDGITLDGASVTLTANGGSAKVSAAGFDAMNGAFTVV